MDTCSLHVELPTGREVAGRARQAVRDQLDRSLANPALEELLLAVSEMVTMVLRTATEPTMSLRVTWRPDLVRVEVHDGPAEVQPGMGGRLLTVLAERWGVTAAPPAVWAEMATA